MSLLSPLSVQYLVFGYVKNIEKKHVLTHNIPIVLKHLCLTYYHINEYFAQIGQGIILSQNKKCISLNPSHPRNVWANVYGSLPLDLNTNNKVYKWTFKVIKEKHGNIWIGIHPESMWANKLECFAKYNDCAYCSNAAHSIYANARSNDARYFDAHANATYAFSAGDTVIMHISLGIFRFAINGKECDSFCIQNSDFFRNEINDSESTPIRCKLIMNNFKMAVSICNNAKIELIEYVEYETNSANKLDSFDKFLENFDWKTEGDMLMDPDYDQHELHGDIREDFDGDIRTEFDGDIRTEFDGDIRKEFDQISDY